MTSKNHTIPVPNPTKSFWHSANDKDDESFKTLRSTPDLPTETDLVIVGSGFSGSSLAYYLSKSETVEPPQTLLLEARDICSGATGRNGGHCKPEYYQSFLKHEQMYDLEEACRIGQFEYENLLEVKKIIKENEIDCDFVLTRCFAAHNTDRSAKEAKSNIERALNAPYDQRILDDLYVVEGEEAALITKVKDTKIAISFTTGQLWPFKLIKALLKVALKKSFLNLQANTPVLEIETLEDGSYLVKTERGSVRTKQIVLATNAYTSGLCSKFNGKIVPVKGTCCHIVTPEQKAPYLTNTYSCKRDKNEFEYLINRPDGSIIVGGGQQFYQQDLETWYGNIDDSKLFEPTSEYPHEEYFKNFMGNTYYTWEGVTTKVDYLWTGIMGYTADMLPFTGEVPGEPNKFVSAGFNGHGMPRVMLCSKAISECILDGKTIEETCIPKSFMLTEHRLNTVVNTLIDSLSKHTYTDEEIDKVTKRVQKVL